MLHELLPEQRSTFLKKFLADEQNRIAMDSDDWNIVSNCLRIDLVESTGMQPSQDLLEDLLADIIKPSGGFLTVQDFEYIDLLNRFYRCLEDFRALADETIQRLDEVTKEAQKRLEETTEAAIQEIRDYHP